MLVRNYVKRLRMEAPLRHVPAPDLPRHFDLVPWDEDLLSVHAEVKWLCFRDSLDAEIFPNLGNIDGCMRLMHTISDHAGFVPEATWLVRCDDGFCGCIQGVRGARRMGMIQNLGVVEECRGVGLGRALLAAAMIGFRQVGLTVAQLEVCARNSNAVRLYHAAGFDVKKTLYRETKSVLNEYAI